MNFFVNNKVKYLNRFVFAVGSISLYSYLKDSPKWFRYMFAQKKEIQLLKEKYGEGWAIITGATGGLGLSFAQELSQIGFNTILISRDEEKLKETTEMLEEKYKIKSKYIPKYGTFKHKIMVPVVNVLPKFITDNIARNMYNEYTENLKN